MSRCFPFPPPGYERKPTIDEPDLLKKEKRKEKKHKKDKKDKEKKDGKEKREKDRSEGKHKEKKDKHRDKKKEKEKSKTSIPDEKNIHTQFEGYNGEILHHNNEQDKQKNGSTGDKKPSIQIPHQNGDLLRSRNKVGDNENFKYVQELDRRIKNDEIGTGSNQFAIEGRRNSVNQFEIQKSDRRLLAADVAAVGGNLAAGRINGATPPLDGRRIEKMKEKGSDVAGFGGNVAVMNRINGVTPPPLDRRIEKMQEKGSDDKRKHKDRDKQKEMEKEKKSEKSKEKSERKKAKRDDNKHIMKIDSVGVANNLSTYPLENSFQGVGDEGNLKKRKANGVSHENEPRPNKMARPTSNISPENGKNLQNPHMTSLNSYNVGIKGGQKVNGMITSPPVTISAKKPPIPAINHVPSKPSPIKSPPVTTNHVAAQSPPTTKPQPTSKPPPSVPNHHQLPPLSSPPPPLPLQPPTTSVKQPMTQPKPPLPPPPASVNKATPPPPPPQLPIPKKKPPHPDTKYLTQILSVPKPDPWCGSDDQEWLHSSKAGPTSKNQPPVDEPEVQVWSEAKHIESVDVCALPYVIPY